MRKSLLAATAAAALLSALSVGAEALPAPRLVPTDEASNLMAVRDGCGWRRHFSPRLRRCVWDFRR